MKQPVAKLPGKPSAVIYARVSSKEQEREGFSIPAQLKSLRNYAVERGFVVTREFIDVETAKQSGRTSFGEMVEFLKMRTRGGLDCRTILVEKTDRLYRNFRDYVVIDDLDVEIHLVKENAVLSRDSRSSDKLLHNIKVVLARHYIDNLSEEVKKGMLEKANEGLYPGKAPLGYVNITEGDRRILGVDEAEAAVVAKLFEWYATGQYSLVDLTLKAEEEGLVYKSTRARMIKATVLKILRNPIYYGTFSWAGKPYRGTHKPLISKDLFDRVQVVLEENGQYRVTKQRKRWAFQGLLTCGYCGCAITAETKKGKYVYYHCTNYKGRCKQEYVTEAALARKFGDVLREIQLDAEVIEWVKDALRSSHSDEKQYHEETISGLQNQYKTLQSRIDAMYLDKLDGRVSQGFFDRKEAEWREEQSDVLRKIETHQAANKSYLEDGARILDLASRAAELYDRQPLFEKRRLLDFVLSNSLYVDGAIEPKFRKPFDLIAVASRQNQKEKAASDNTHGLSSCLLGNRDSNPDSQIQSLLSCQLDDSPTKAKSF